MSAQRLQFAFVLKAGMFWTTTLYPSIEVFMVPQGRLMHPKGAVLQTATFKTPTTLSFPTARSLFHKPELL